MRAPAVLRTVWTPANLWRPAQLARRLAWHFRRAGRERATVRLPWGMPIRCFAHDAVGLSIQQSGLIDLAVSEALWRLADPGELAVDAGANIGQMTSLLARRVGPAGRVVAFEPNPELREELEFNAAAWRALAGQGAIDVDPRALTTSAGEAELLLPIGYDWNRGIARLASEGAGDGRRVRVPCVRLDEAFGAGAPVGLLKLDVEGHERAVLEGAAGLLAAGAVRDIIYEEHEAYPNDTSRLLERHGYSVSRLETPMRGPRLIPAGARARGDDWESPNYLATLEPARAAARFQPAGWYVLRTRRAPAPSVARASRPR